MYILKAPVPPEKLAVTVYLRMSGKHVAMGAGAAAAQPAPTNSCATLKRGAHQRPAPSIGTRGNTADRSRVQEPRGRTASSTAPTLQLREHRTTKIQFDACDCGWAEPAARARRGPMSGRSGREPGPQRIPIGRKAKGAELNHHHPLNGLNLKRTSFKMEVVI